MTGLAFGLLAQAGCNSGRAQRIFALAEQLWSEGNYSAALGEFEKAAAKDPQGELGQRALYRAATTQALFLSQYPEAIRKLQAFVEATKDPAARWEAEKLIGELYFSRLEQHEQVIRHYEALLKKRPTAPEAPEFWYRMGRSHFFLWQFNEALLTYRGLISQFPRSMWAEKAAFEIGVTLATEGSSARGCQEAMKAYQDFLERYPRSELVPQARFGIASCLEERNQLDAAYQAYLALQKDYPSPGVIQVKLARIHERVLQKSH